MMPGAKNLKLLLGERLTQRTGRLPSWPAPAHPGTGGESIGCLISDEVRGAVDEFQFQIVVGVLLVAALN